MRDPSENISRPCGMKRWKIALKIQYIRFIGWDEGKQQTQHKQIILFLSIYIMSMKSIK